MPLSKKCATRASCDLYRLARTLVEEAQLRRVDGKSDSVAQAHAIRDRRREAGDELRLPGGYGRKLLVAELLYLNDLAAEAGIRAVSRNGDVLGAEADQQGIGGGTKKIDCVRRAFYSDAIAGKRGLVAGFVEPARQ